MRQKSALKIATFRASDWLRSATAWRGWIGLLSLWRAVVVWRRSTVPSVFRVGARSSLQSFASFPPCPRPQCHLASVEVEQHVYKADVEGNVLTLTSCELRFVRTESSWMPTDLVKFPVHSMRLLRKNLRHLAGLCRYFIYIYILLSQ